MAVRFSIGSQTGSPIGEAITSQFIKVYFEIKNNKQEHNQRLI